MPTTPTDIAATTAAHLEQSLGPLVQVSVASDPYNVYERLMVQPTGALCVVHWGGDRQEGRDYRSPRVRAQIEVYLSRGKGLAREPGRHLVQADAGTGEPAFLDLVEELRQAVLAVRYAPSGDADHMPDNRPHYISTEPVPMPDGMPLSAYKLTFGLYHAITAPSFLGG